MYEGFHVKYSLILSDFNDLEFFCKDFSEKYPNIIFHENPSSKIRLVPWGQTDMTKLILWYLG